MGAGLVLAGAGVVPVAAELVPADAVTGLVSAGLVVAAAGSSAAMAAPGPVGASGICAEISSGRACCAGMAVRRWAAGPRSAAGTSPPTASAIGVVTPFGWRDGPDPDRLSLACRSSASSNPNPSRTRAHGMIAALSSADRCGIPIAAACTALPAATPPSSSSRHSQEYTRLIRPAPRNASTEQAATTTMASKISG